IALVLLHFAADGRISSGKGVWARSRLMTRTQSRTMKSRQGRAPRSAALWVFWIVIIAVAIATISLTIGRNQANPTDATAAIFGILGVFLVIFFVVKVREIAALKAADLRGTADAAERASSRAHAATSDPTALADPELYAAMATTPIDAAAVRAREKMWDIPRK